MTIYHPKVWGWQDYFERSLLCPSPSLNAQHVKHWSRRAPAVWQHSEMHHGTESLHNNRQKGKAMSVTMPKLAATDIPWASKSSQSETCAETHDSMQHRYIWKKLYQGVSFTNLQDEIVSGWMRAYIQLNDEYKYIYLLRFHVYSCPLAKNNVKLSSQRSGY